MPYICFAEKVQKHIKRLLSRLDRFHRVFCLYTRQFKIDTSADSNCAYSPLPPPPSPLPLPPFPVTIQRNPVFSIFTGKCPTVGTNLSNEPVKCATVQLERTSPDFFVFGLTSILMKALSHQTSSAKDQGKNELWFDHLINVLPRCS